MKKDGSKVKMKFKSLKASVQQTITLSKRSVFFSSQGVRIFPAHKSTKGMVFKLGNGDKNGNLMRLLKDNSDRKVSKNGFKLNRISKLVFDRGKGAFYIHVVLEWQKKWGEDEDDNQVNIEPRVIALDPGVRTFQTGHSPNGDVIEFAPGDIGKLARLHHWLDKLSSDISKCKNNKTKRRRLRLRRFKAQSRINNLVSEVHKQTASYLVKHFDVILLPEFGTQNMVRKLQRGGKKRLIGRRSVRKLLVRRHYQFKIWLLQKAAEYGKTVVIVDESYTSKTCSSCGWYDYNLRGKKVFNCSTCDLVLDRDVNAAKNIILKNTC